MFLNEELIKEFCRKHSMEWEDREMQLKCVVEEVAELLLAPFDKEKEEIADVLVTLLVFAEINGFLEEVEDEFEKKMQINLEKPARKGRGKVKKGV